MIDSFRATEAVARLFVWLSGLMLILASCVAFAQHADVDAFHVGQDLQARAVVDGMADVPLAKRQQLRIVALAPHVVELLYSIGAGDQIVATTDYADYPEAAKQIPRAGSYTGLQIEKILQLKPDLVIGWKTGNPTEDLDRLVGYGIPVVYSHMKALEDIARELQFYGYLTGREASAHQQAADYLQQLSDLRDSYQGRKSVKVFYELWSRPLTTVAGAAWPQQQLDLCGGANPFRGLSRDYPQVSIERVVETLPELILQPNHNGKPNADAIGWQQWPEIPAVANGHIEVINADYSHRMTLRVLQAISQLCEIVDGVRMADQQAATVAVGND